MTEHLPDGGARISWLRGPDVVFYRVKRGTPATTDGNDPSGYRLLRAKTRDIPGSALPLKLCSVAIDVIGQSSVLTWFKPRHRNRPPEPAVPGHDCQVRQARSRLVLGGSMERNDPPDLLQRQLATVEPLP